MVFGFVLFRLAVVAFLGLDTLGYWVEVAPSSPHAFDNFKLIVIFQFHVGENILNPRNVKL